MKPLSDQEIETLREELANYAHVTWSHWMEHLLLEAVFHLDGTATITEKAVDRRMDLMNTDYSNLSEDMKEKDRVEADKILVIVSNKRDKAQL